MTYIQKLGSAFAALILASMLVGMACISLWAIPKFEQGLVPEVEAKTVMISKAVGALVERALSRNISIDELVGIEDLFKNLMENNREIGVAAISGQTGDLLYANGPMTETLKEHFKKNAAAELRPISPSASLLVDHVFLISQPLTLNNRVIGHLHIGNKDTFVMGIQQETLLDLLVVTVIASIVSVEILIFCSGRGEFLSFVAFATAIQKYSQGNFSSSAKWVAHWPLTTKIYAAVENIQTRHQNLKVEILQRLKNKLQHSREGLLLALTEMRSLQKEFHFTDTVEETTEDQAVAELKNMRAPFFLFLMADDLSRPFIPEFAASLHNPVDGISAGFITAFPITVFMLAVALSQPMIGGWIDNAGERKALLAGCVMACIAHIGSACATSVYDLILWRGLAGLAWGMMFVGCQSIILKTSKPANRTQGLAFFVGIIMTSSICGPALGGILAEGIGFRPTVAIAILLVLTAFRLIWKLIPPSPPQQHKNKPTYRNFIDVLKNRRLMVLLVTASMPSKIILVGFCYYLIPLYMPLLESSSAMAGRLNMLYGIFMVLLVPLTSRWAIKMPQRYWIFVLTGLLLSGLGGIAPIALPGLAGIMVLVSLLGIGQAFSISPQTAMVPDLCKDQVSQLGASTVLGIYRLIERIGNTLGSLIAALLLQWLTFPQTFAAIGGIVLVCAVIFGLTFGILPAHRPAASRQSGAHQ